MVTSTPIDGHDGSSSTARIHYSFLSRALWKRFREADTVEGFCQTWLGLTCQFVDRALNAVVVLGEPETGPFTPLAWWPEEAAGDDALTKAADHAISQRKGIALGPSGAANGETLSLALPISVDQQLFGVVAVSLSADADAHRAMRELQWSIAWLEVLIRREQGRSDDQLRQRTMVAFDMVAAVLEQRDSDAACNALVTELATRLACDRVSIGFRNAGAMKLAAISHSARFGERMNLVREIASAMDEAVDQQAVVLFPAQRDWAYRVTRAHAELAAAQRTGAILTVPLSVHGAAFGALTFESFDGGGFDEQSVEMCDAVASVVGPILFDKRSNDRPVWAKLREAAQQQLVRLFGPRYPGRKIAAAVAVLLLAVLVIVPGEYRVTSPAVIEGLVQRSVIAPFDGYIASQEVRAGEVVEENQLLATLDRQELALERMRWSTQRQQSLAEYDQALARRERAETNIIRAQIDQAQAQIELLDAQLERTQLRAPFAGVVVSGDLSQIVGSSVARGQQLFQIAPLDEHRVVVNVDETSISDIRVGQSGSLRLASFPQASMSFTVERLTPVSEQADGRNYFRVEARLDQQDARLRPGMEGIAKTSIEDRALIRIWTHDLVDWMRLTLWRLMP